MQIAVEEYAFHAGFARERRFAFVSDLHECDSAPVLQLIRQSGVDAVLVGGDVIHDHEKNERGLAFLRACAAEHKTFCCIGNHERYYRGDLSALIGATGAVLLDNAAVEYDGLVIGGLSSGYTTAEVADCKKRGLLWRFQPTPPPQLSFLDDFCRMPGYKLLLCHHPEYWSRYVRQLPVELTLSGHAHGGQWRLFGQGVFAPGQGILPRYTSGLYQGRLLVSRGLGNPHHHVPRINNTPMIAVITLT